MRKAIRIGFPIICIVIIIVTFWMIGDIKKKVKENKIINENNNKIKNEVINEVENKDEESFFGRENDIAFNKATQVLKEFIIEENVYFTDEGIEDGRCIIAVRDKESTEAKQFYIVNIETEEIEIYY